MSRAFGWTLVLLMLGCSTANGITIYDVQFSSPPDYVSPLLGSTVTVTGGVVTHIASLGMLKVTIQDPEETRLYYVLGASAAETSSWSGIKAMFR